MWKEGEESLGAIFLLLIPEQCNKLELGSCVSTCPGWISTFCPEFVDASKTKSSECFYFEK